MSDLPQLSSDQCDTPLEFHHYAVIDSKGRMYEAVDIRDARSCAKKWNKGEPGHRVVEVLLREVKS